MIGQEGQDYNTEQEQQRRSGGSAAIRACDTIPQEGDAGPRRAHAGGVQRLQGKVRNPPEARVFEPAGLKPDSREAYPRRARVT